MKIDNCLLTGLASNPSDKSGHKSYKGHTLPGITYKIYSVHFFKIISITLFTKFDSNPKCSPERYNSMRKEFFRSFIPMIFSKLDKMNKTNLNLSMR